MTNVVHISNARSYSPPDENRWIDVNTLKHIFSLSDKTIRNYVAGGYTRQGEWHEYPRGKMPCMKLPGGGLRFNMVECKKWLSGEVSPVDES